MKVHEKLRVSGDYSFCNGDFVTYESDQGKQHCVLFYDEELGAFLLLHYEDYTYTSPKIKENGENDVAFLHEVGLDSLFWFVSTT